MAIPGVDLSKLTQTQQKEVQNALTTGNPTGLTPEELSIFNSIMKDPGASAGQKQELAQQLSGGANSQNSMTGLTLEKRATAQPQVSTSSSETVSKDSTGRKKTTVSTITTTESSEVFYASDAEVAKKAADLAAKSKNQKTAESEKAKNGGFYADATEIVANAVPPEVNEAIVYPDPKGYQDDHNPTDPENSKNCDIGVVKKYLKDSSDPEIKDLAIRAEQGDLEATRTLTTRIASWQKPQVENAKKIQDIISKGGSYDDAIKAGVADEYGFPIMPGDKPIVVPAKFASTIDKDIIDPLPIKSKPDKDTPSLPEPGDETMRVQAKNGKGEAIFYNPNATTDQDKKIKGFVEALSTEKTVTLINESGYDVKDGDKTPSYKFREMNLSQEEMKAFDDDKDSQFTAKEARAHGLNVPDEVSDDTALDLKEYRSPYYQESISARELFDGKSDPYRLTASSDVEKKAANGLLKLDPDAIVGSGSIHTNFISTDTKLNTTDWLYLGTGKKEKPKTTE